jgi:hypothetical protein
MRLKLLAALTLLVAAAPAQGAVRGLGSWDPIAQRMVREAGVLPSLASGGFGGAQRIDGTELNGAFAALSLRLGVPAVQVGAGHVSVTRFDALLVEQLGMSDASSRCASTTTRPTTPRSSIRGRRSRAPRPRGRWRRCCNSTVPSRRTRATC